MHSKERPCPLAIRLQKQKSSRNWNFPGIPHWGRGTAWPQPEASQRGNVSLDHRLDPETRSDQ